LIIVFEKRVFFYLGRNLALIHSEFLLLITIVWICLFITNKSEIININNTFGCPMIKKIKTKPFATLLIESKFNRWPIYVNIGVSFIWIMVWVKIGEVGKRTVSEITNTLYFTKCLEFYTTHTRVCIRA